MKRYDYLGLEGEDGEWVRYSDVEELARECLVWCEMAYLGNADERQALQAIRGRLARFAEPNTLASLASPSTPTTPEENPIATVFAVAARLGRGEPGAIEECLAQIAVTERLGYRHTAAALRVMVAEAQAKASGQAEPQANNVGLARDSGGS